MKYTFGRHDPIPDSIIFVLILDIRRKRERILIGSENCIALRLNGSEEDNIFYDRTAPLGSLLMNFHQDIDRTWNQYGFIPFWDALHSNRWKLALTFDLLLIVSKKSSRSFRSSVSPV